MSDLAQISQEIDNNVITALSDIDANDKSGLTLQELRKLDKMMQTYRGALVDNLGKLQRLDENIALEETRLKTVTEADRLAIERCDLRS